MSREIEISELDLRYESYRMRSSVQEAKLTASIAERGIEEPLEGVDTGAGHILLNGFKRYRSARKLHIEVVPYTSLGVDGCDSNPLEFFFIETGRGTEIYLDGESEEPGAPRFAAKPFARSAHCFR